MLSASSDRHIMPQQAHYTLLAPHLHFLDELLRDLNWWQIRLRKVPVIRQTCTESGANGPPVPSPNASDLGNICCSIYTG